MLTCKVCGKKLRNPSALGGHMSQAHPQSQGKPAKPQAVAQEAAPAEAQPEASATQESATVEGEVKELGSSAEPVTEATPVSTEPDKAESIRQLLRQGYSPRQIKEQFGYARATVDQVAAEFIKPDNAPRDQEAGYSLPVMKVGKGVEVIAPETLLRRYMDGDQDEAELRGMMKLRAAMLMVSDLINMRKAEAEAIALEIKPILDLMKETRSEQDAAAERAQSSSLEAAREAAREVLDKAIPYLDERLESVERSVERSAEKKPDIASVSNPMQGMMARTMETMLNQLLRAFGFAGAPGEAGQQEIPGFVQKNAGQ